MSGRGNHDLVGESQIIRDVIELVDKVAETDYCVLIEGETGTGKELVARRLHSSSPRHSKPFIPVNCAGISETLFESQFFGHVRGAFTGAERASLGLVRSAEEGTLFMDEVGDIPLELQPKLLRVLQDGEVMAVGSNQAVPVNTRFVAATNHNLQECVQDGRFRADLFYRLNVVRIHVPPLRSRPDDVTPLLDHFLDRCAQHLGRPVIPVSKTVRQKLSDYSWPGNVRELVSWVERLYATQLEPEALTSSVAISPRANAADAMQGLVSLDEAQRVAIVNVLEACDHNRTRAARILGVNRGTLLRKIAEYQVV